MEGLVNFRDWYFPTSSIIAILHLIEWSDLVNCLSHDEGCCTRNSYHCWRSMCWHLLDLVLTNVTLVHQWQACVSQFCNNLSSFIFQILTRNIFFFFIYRRKYWVNEHWTWTKWTITFTRFRTMLQTDFLWKILKYLTFAKKKLFFMVLQVRGCWTDCQDGCSEFHNQQMGTNFRHKVCWSLKIFLFTILCLMPYIFINASDLQTQMIISLDTQTISYGRYVAIQKYFWSITISSCKM